MQSQLIRHRTALGTSLVSATLTKELLQSPPHNMGADWGLYRAHTHFNSRFTLQLVDDSYTRVSVEIGCDGLHAYIVAFSKDKGRF
jgi:hypothetical protein